MLCHTSGPSALRSGRAPSQASTTKRKPNQSSPPTPNPGQETVPRNRADVTVIPASSCSSRHRQE